MKIVILGAGAIGRLLGVYLSRGGHLVVLVDPNQEIVDTLNSQGIGFMESEANDPADVTWHPITAVTSAELIDPCDLVLLAVKSFDTVVALQGAQHLVSETSPVVTLQTGLGNIENLERIIDRGNIIGGFTFMTGTSFGAGIVKLGSLEKSYLGELDGGISQRLTTICELFTDCGMICTPVRRFLGRLWSKVIIISAINAASSILRVRNGELLDNMESITLMKRLVDEGSAVARAQSIDLVFHDLYQLLFDGCRRGEHNLSSMFQDILEGKRTEVDAQCGAIVNLGEQAGVPVPTQQTMLELIRLISKKQAGNTGKLYQE